MDYAAKSVFANDTALSKAASGVRNSLKDGHPAASAAMDLIMPFTKVPSAVITRLFDYTPAGVVKEAAKQIQKGSFDQRALAQAIGETATGTGTIALGMMLAHNGQITGPMPKDQRERDLWTLQGKQPNAIRFGDKWYSFNYTSPVGQVLQLGAQVSKAVDEGKGALAAISTGITGGANAVIDQSFLQGIQGALDALTDPQRYAEQFVEGMTGSAIPTLVADVARATDPLQRQVNGAIESVTSRLPGVRQTLLPKQDAFGAELQRTSSPIGAMVDPFRRTNVKGDTLSSELERMQKVNQPVMPNADGSKFIQVGNVKYPLTPSQLNQLNTATGQPTEKYWNEAIGHPIYKEIGDDSKKKALDSIYYDINAVNKYKLMQESGNQEAADKLFAKFTSLQTKYYDSGGLDVEDYLRKQLPNPPKTQKEKSKKQAKVKSSGRRGRSGGGAGGYYGKTKSTVKGTVSKSSVSVKSPGKLKGSVKYATSSKPKVSIKKALT
jgi:hypothetical protein